MVELHLVLQTVPPVDGLPEGNKVHHPQQEREAERDEPVGALEGGAVGDGDEDGPLRDDIADGESRSFCFFVSGLLHLFQGYQS